MTGAEKDFGAHVFLQWVALSETNPVPKLIATVSVKEVNDPKLANASIEIEAKRARTMRSPSRELLRFRCGQGHHPVRQGHRAGRVHYGEGATKAPAAPPPNAGTNVPKDD